MDLSGALLESVRTRANTTFVVVDNWVVARIILNVGRGHCVFACLAVSFALKHRQTHRPTKSILRFALQAPTISYWHTGTMVLMAVRWAAFGLSYLFDSTKGYPGEGPHTEQPNVPHFV